MLPLQDYNTSPNCIPENQAFYHNEASRDPQTTPTHIRKSTAKELSWRNDWLRVFPQSFYWSLFQELHLYLMWPIDCRLSFSHRDSRQWTPHWSEAEMSYMFCINCSKMWSYSFTIEKKKNWVNFCLIGLDTKRVGVIKGSVDGWRVIDA